MNYTVTQIDWDTGSEQLHQLRERVYVLERQLSASLVFDDKDKTAFHVIAIDSENNPIATARITNKGEIGRFAVRTNYRSLGLYKAIFAKLVDVAKANNLRTISVCCNLQIVDDLTLQGFTPQGRVYMEGGIPVQRLACPIENNWRVPDMRQLH